MWKTFYQGWVTGFRLWRVALIVYTIQTLLVLTIGFQVFHVLEASIGQSAELQLLVKNFDYTVMMDLLNVHGASLSPLFGQLRWIVLIYIPVAAFIRGGVLFAVFRKGGGWRTFWTGGMEYFFPFFKMALIFLAIFFLLTALMWLPFLGSAMFLLETLPSEKGFVLLFSGLLILFGVVILHLFNWSTLAHFLYMKQPRPLGKALTSAAKMYVQNWRSVSVVSVLFVFLLLIVTGLYWVLESMTGMVNPFLIVVFIVIQQAFVLFKVIWRMMIYRGVWEAAFEED